MDHSGALVKWIWGPYQKSQAESGDRGPGDVGVGLEDDPEFMCSGRCAGQAGGGEDCEKREVSWDVLGCLSQAGVGGPPGGIHRPQSSIMKGQVPGGAFCGPPPKKRQSVGVREEEGEPVWALPASSVLGSARWDGQFYHHISQTSEHGGSEPGWDRVCGGSGDSDRSHPGTMWEESLTGQV